MSVHSGKFAAVNGQAGVAQWQVSDQMTTVAMKASNTKGGTARRRGVRAWSGSMKQYGDTPDVMPGETFSFEGFTAPEDDVSTNGGIVSGTVIVDSVTVTWNWETGAVVSYVTAFSGDLAITYGTAAPIVDSSDFTAPSICGCPIKYIKYSGSVPADTTYANITQATLVISAANASYVNSSTSCNTGRKPGDIDWTLALTEQNTEVHADVIIGADLGFKIYSSNTRFWEVKTGIVESYSNFVVDRESNSIISRQVNIGMNAAPTDGYSTPAIILPDTTTWWP